MDMAKEIVIAPDDTVTPFGDIRGWAQECEPEEVPDSLFFPSGKPYIEHRQGPFIVTTITLKSGEVLKWSELNPGYNPTV